MMMLHLPDAAAQLACGAALAPALAERAGAIFLHGDLGTGKTTLVRGLLRGLGFAGAVRSPTYTLIEPYTIGAWPLFHLDLYRLGAPEELHDLGWRELFDDKALVLIEWPERGAGVLPEPQLRIELTMASDGGRWLRAGGAPEWQALVANALQPAAAVESFRNRN